MAGAGVRKTCCAAALITICMLSPATLSFAENPAQQPGLARQLLQGCLAGPTRELVTKLATQVKAIPYSAVRAGKELGRRQISTVVDDLTRPDEAQRTETSVTAFSGWDLPGPGAGGVEYREENYRMARVQVATGQLLSAWRAARTRACRLHAPVANAKAIFELYEQLQPADYGILVSENRRWVSVFTFEQERYDIELHFQLDSPLAGLAPGKEGTGMSRLILEDGGPRFDNPPGPETATVNLTRAQLLSAWIGRPTWIS